MQTRKLLFYFLLICSVLSCTKQTPVSIKSEVRDASEYRRFSICAEANFIKGLMEQGNLLKTFECLKWDSEFPVLYNAISSVNRESWNGLTAVIDQEIFNDRNKKQKFLQLIKKLDQDGALDDLMELASHVLTPQLWGSLREVFLCPSNPDCKNGITQKDLLLFLSILNQSTENQLLLIDTFKILKRLSHENREEFDRLVHHLLTEQKHERGRIRFFDGLAKITGVTSKKELVSYLSALLTAKNENKNRWLYNFLRDQTTSQETFDAALSYVVLDDKKLISHAAHSMVYAKNPVICEQSKNGDEILYVDLRANINKFVDDFITAKRSDFLSLLRMHTNNVMVATDLCAQLRYISPTISEAQKKYDLIESFHSFGKYILNPTSYLLSKQLFSVAKKESGSGVSLLGYFEEPLTEDLLNYLEVTKKIYPEAFKDLFKILLSLKPSDMDTLSQIFTQWKEADPESALTVTAKIWLSLDEQGKSSLLKVWDSHFAKDVARDALFSFYENLLLTFRKELQTIGSSLSQTPKSIDYAVEFFNVFSQKEVLKEAKSFFTRDQILKLIYIMASSNTTPSMTPEQESVSRRIAQDQFIMPYILAPKESSEDRSVVECLSVLAAEGMSYQKYILNPPRVCRESNTGETSTKFLTLLSKIDQEIRLYGKQNGKESLTLFRERGLLGKENMNTLIGIISSIEKETATKKGGVRDLLRFLRGELLTPLRLGKGHPVGDALEIPLTLLQIEQKIEQGMGGRAPLMQQDLLKKMSERESTQRVSNYLNDLGVLLQAPPLSPEISLVRQDTKSHYKELSESERLQFLSQLIGMLTDAQHSPSQTSILESLISLASPKSGVSLPTMKESRKRYVMKTSEVLSFLYDTSDRNLAINQKMTTRLNHQTNQRERLSLTTLEKIEFLLSEMSFDNNFLPIHFINSLATTSNYKEMVASKVGLFKACSWFRFCGKRLTNEQVTRTQNAFSALDAFEALPVAFKRDYSSLVIALSGLIVKNSPLPSQSTTLVSVDLGITKLEIPWATSDESIKNHHINLLLLLAKDNSFSRIAQELHRLFPTRVAFQNFLESEAMQLMDNQFLNVENWVQIKRSVDGLLKKEKALIDLKEESVLGTLIRYVDKKSSSETAKIESMLAKTLTLINYSMSLKKSSPLKLKESGYLLLSHLAFENHATILNLLTKSGLRDYEGDELVDDLDDLLSFFYQGLWKNSALEGPLSLVLIESQNFLSYLLRLEQGALSQGLSSYMQNDPKAISQIDRLLRLMHHYKILLGFEKKKRAVLLGQRLEKLMTLPRVEIEPLRSYLAITSMPCIGSPCLRNEFYLEPFYLRDFILLQDREGEIKARKMFNYILKTEANSISTFIESVFPHLTIKKVTP